MAKDLIRVKGHGKLSEVRNEVYKTDYYSKIGLSKIISKEQFEQIKEKPLKVEFDEQIRSNNFFINFYGEVHFSSEKNKLKIVLKLEEILFQYLWKNTAKETDFQMFYEDMKKSKVKHQTWQIIEKTLVERYLYNDFEQVFNDEKQDAILYIDSLDFSEDLPEVKHKEINQFLEAFSHRIEALKEKYIEKIKQLDY